MKKITNFLIFFVCVFAAVYLIIKIWPKSSSPLEQVAANNKDLNVSIIYSRPYMHRKIFGELVPYGTVWRTGANAATLITFSKNCTFGGLPLKAGKYSLWTVPDKENWTVILNTQTDQWGTDYDESKDVLRVKTKVKKLENPITQLKINLLDEDSKIMFNLEWELTQIKIAIL